MLVMARSIVSKSVARILLSLSSGRPLRAGPVGSSGVHYTMTTYYDDAAPAVAGTNAYLFLRAPRRIFSVEHLNEEDRTA